MNLVKAKIEITCRLELTRREVELLENVTSYGNKQWADIICGDHGNSYNGGVKAEEVVVFLDKLRDAAGSMKTEVNKVIEGAIR